MADLSRILDGFRPSLIGEIFSLATRLKEEGRDIVDLSIGEPDFDTPEHVCETAIDAIRGGATKYTSTDADSIFLTRTGVPTGLVSVPNRYMHSPNEVVSLSDLESTAKLLAAFVRSLTAETDFTPL